MSERENGTPVEPSGQPSRQDEKEAKEERSSRYRFVISCRYEQDRGST